MMKAAQQDSGRTGLQMSARGPQGRRAGAVLLLLAACSTSAPAAGTQVPLTDAQLAEQTAGAATLKVSGKLFPADGHFPQSGFTGATFQVLANGRDAQDNGQYQWRSNQPWARVDKDGTVTFTDMPTAATLALVLKATPVAGGPPLTLPLPVSRWFINAKTERMARPAAEAWCNARGDGFALPAAAAMTTATDGTLPPRAANGALWNAWGPMALYRSGWQLDNYWASQKQDDKREMVGLVNGNFHWVPDSSKYLVTCVRGLQ